MLSNKVEAALNKQIAVEADASFHYLAMASWCDTHGLEGAAKFFYLHSEEEREHMLRIFKYVNDSGGHASTPSVKEVPKMYKSLKAIIEIVIKQEAATTKAVHKLMDLCIKENDHSSVNFVQWFVAEQHEEEKLFTGILDKLNMLGGEGSAMYFIDKDLGDLAKIKEAAPPEVEL